MQEVMFTVQTITPLIMSGANQYILELRPPSLRGLMRYWQRTMVVPKVKTVFGQK